MQIKNQNIIFSPTSNYIEKSISNELHIKYLGNIMKHLAGHIRIFLLFRFKTIFLKKNKKDFLNSFFFWGGDSLSCIKMEDFPIHYRMALRL